MQDFNKLYVSNRVVERLVHDLRVKGHTVDSSGREVTVYLYGLGSIDIEIVCRHHGEGETVEDLGVDYEVDVVNVELYGCLSDIAAGARDVAHVAEDVERVMGEIMNLTPDELPVEHPVTLADATREQLVEALAALGGAA